MELPIELICEIALAAPGAYYRLVQTCKLIGNSIKINVMDHFAVYRLGGRKDMFWKQFAWRLPNGLLHSPNNSTPALVFDFDQELSIEGNGDCYEIIIVENIYMEYSTGYSDIFRELFIYAEDKDEFWFRCGQLHRENDLPAVIHNDGNDKYWFINGLLHRDYDQPASFEIMFKVQGYVEYLECWFSHGEYHRIGNPAIIETKIDDSGRGESYYYYEYNTHIEREVAEPWYLQELPFE